MAQARLVGARLLVWGGPDYPASLMDLPDARRSSGRRATSRCSTVRWSRWWARATPQALGCAWRARLAEGLGEAGHVLVSGRRGIDAAAHDAALPTGTVAVQAGGVDAIYPEENAALATRIAIEGCRISEQPIGLVPQARHFPLRNRIVSGLSRAVVVVEAAARSGSLITARTALDQGREVLAVPGHPFDARAAGCNMLLRDGRRWSAAPPT